MQSKYIAAIMAGIVGGILLAAYAVVGLVLELVAWNGWVPGINIVSSACGCLAIPAIIVIALVTGVLAAMWAKGLTKLVDAAITAAIAGALAGLIYGVVNVIVAFLKPVIMFGSAVDTTDLMGGLALGSLFGAGGGVLTCICAPVWLIIIMIIAAIGGAIWGALKLKLT